jgi:KaiC/GvpD/RAD55 family RecA-like ATPase
MRHGESILQAVDGDVENAVRGLLAAVRAQWRAFWPAASTGPEGTPDQWVAHFQKVLHGELERLELDSETLAHALTEAVIAQVGADRNLPGRRLQSHALLQATLGSLFPAADLRYFAVREARRRFDLTFSSESAWLVRQLTEAANAAFDHEGRCLISNPERGFMSALRKTLERSPPKNREGWERLPEFFLEFLGILDFARATDSPDAVQLLLPRLSSDSLLSHLFGVPTAIEGFDELLGGGGLMLADNCDPPLERRASYRSDEVAGDRIGGRTVLTVGQFGGGKSLLTLQFAIEVARKGGVAWVMALEQTVEECLFSIESLGISIHDQRFPVVTDLPSAVEALATRKPGVGALVFLKFSQSSYPGFLDEVEGKLSWMGKYPLRLLIVDPINALLRDEKDLRARTMGFFRKAKDLQVNLWITCERQEDDTAQERFEENISDTVLHVGVNRQHQHQERYIEVTKSRLQREQPGPHTLVIQSGEGIRVYPNSASVNDAGSTREYPPVEQLVNFGVARLGEVLGEGAVLPGDLIAYHGPTGTSKSLCGLQFLMDARDRDGRPGRALFVADFSLEWMQQQVSEARKHRGNTAEVAQVDYYAIAPGYVAPGEVLQRIADQLSQAYRRGIPYSRILLTNLTRWIMGMPFLKEDPVFGIALVNLLRRHGATSVLVLGYTNEEETRAFSKLMLDHADCVVRFSRIPIRGQSCQVIDVEKTRSMNHRRDSWELITDAGGARVVPSLALVRLDPSGGMVKVPIALHLHSDTPAHARYNLRILHAVKSSLSHEARLEKQELSYDPNVLPLVAASGIDELQVLQLDEFQLPRGGSSAASKLREFSTAQAADLIEGRLPELVGQVVRGRGFIAVPFYTNFGLLAYRRDGFSPFPEGWGELAHAARVWEKDHPGEIFFSCHVTPTNNFESYNCLFLEILHSISGNTPAPEKSSGAKTSGGCELANLLVGPAPRKAAHIFWTLCHRSHGALLAALKKKKKKNLDVSDFAKAQVWRHWFSTYTQMVEADGGVPPSELEVVPLYGRGKGHFITTAGEWYLGVPAHSVAEEVGLEIIRFLTAPAREIQRLNLGVGLPTRADFYAKSKQEFPQASVSKHFRMHPLDAGKLVSTALRRSDYSCYQLSTETIATHLTKLLEVTDAKEIGGHIQTTLDNLRSGIDFIRAHQDGPCCAGCRAHTTRLSQIG